MPSPVAVLLWLATQAGEPGGTLRIAVIDAATGQALSDVTVTLVDAARLGATGANGRYVFTNVWPGPHHIAARRPGYAPRVLHALVPGTGTLDLILALTRLPERLQGVRVESRRTVPLRDVDAVETAHAGDRWVSRAAIRNHPLLAEPDPLLALSGGHVAAKPESPGGLHVFGGASDHVAYFVDGIPFLNPYHAGGTFTALNTDALAGVELRLPPRSDELADALSGVVTASTRQPTNRVEVFAGLSATQARLTTDIPVPISQGTSLLVSGRLLFPGLIGQKHEAAHIDGDDSDALIRLATPAGGGTLRILALDSRSALTLADRVVDEDTAAVGHNDLHWGSRSTGVSWERRGPDSYVTFSAWRATSVADVVWMADSAPLILATRLRDAGVHGFVRAAVDGGEWTLGVRAHRRASGYTAASEGPPSRGLDLQRSVFLTTVQSSWTQRLSSFHEVSTGILASLYRGRMYPGPFVEWTWRPATALSITASVSRRAQFTQSLRNSESVVANLFPADLSVVSAGPIPVARSDQALGVAVWRPAPSSVVTARLWSRRLTDLVLPAIGSGGPFADSAIASGDGRATGASLDASVSSTRWGVVANYAVQRVRMTARDTTWQPEYGVTHAVDAGLIFFPDPSTSIRFGVSGAVGRRVSGFSGAFEWEACNLRDRGCEFAGGPLRRDEPLGATSLPGYARVDVGVRKHWHLTLGARDVQMAAYATWSNLFDRQNILAYTRDASTNARQFVTMRPSSPLVIGFDWSF